MAVADHLVDKSAWARLSEPAVTRVLLPLLSAGSRAVAIPDLIIAAVAERHDISVLHYDHDFDVIAEITGQPVEWVVPPGTADCL